MRPIEFPETPEQWKRWERYQRCGYASLRDAERGPDGRFLPRRQQAAAKPAQSRALLPDGFGRTGISWPPEEEQR